VASQTSDWILTLTLYQARCDGLGNGAAVTAVDWAEDGASIRGSTASQQVLHLDAASGVRLPTCMTDEDIWATGTVGVGGQVIAPLWLVHLPAGRCTLSQPMQPAHRAHEPSHASKMCPGNDTRPSAQPTAHHIEIHSTRQPSWRLPCFQALPLCDVGP
jgi:hypothetical protein